MRLVNASARPLELHLVSGVVVVAAGDEMTCRPEDLDSPQVKVLTSRGVLRVRQPPTPEEVEQPKPRARHGGKSGRGRKPC
jgi:hypothetical protein